MDGQMDITQTIPRLLEQYRESASPALLCGEEALSYRALLADARKIAFGIRARGVRKGDRVVLTVKRGADYVRAWLGVLYAGGVQVTFHDGWPERLIASAAEECRPVLVLYDAAVRELLASPEPPEDYGAPGELRGGDPFQIVYTSGSTGMPKGVVNCHLTAVSRTSAACGDPLPLYFSRHCSALLLDCSLGFVLSSYCLCLCLLNGKTVVLARKEDIRTPRSLAECARRHRADTIHISPSRFQQHRDDPAFAELLGSMKLVMAGSEAISRRTASLLTEAAGGEAVFCYGASELFGPALYRFASAYHGGDVAFFPPPSCANVLVLNERQQPAEAGESGELCFGGIPGALGRYFGTPSASSPAFFEHPAFGRLYRTGDLAVKQEDGGIRILGRRDSMVKLYGIRVEPEAVEGAFLSYPGIRQAAVKVLGEGSEARLWAWYSANDPVEEPALRRHLSQRLPNYMIPSFFVWMKALPLNQSGKLDRGALTQAPD